MQTTTPTRGQTVSFEKDVFGQTHTIVLEVWSVGRTNNGGVLLTGNTKHNNHGEAVVGLRPGQAVSVLSERIR